MPHNDLKKDSIVAPPLDIRLKENSEHKILSFITDSVDDSVLVTNKTGIILLVNNSFENNFGYSRQELLGKNIEIIEPCETIKELYYNSNYPVLENMISFIRIKRKDGIEFPVSLSTSFMRDERNNDYIVCHIFRLRLAEKYSNNFSDRSDIMERIGRLAGAIAHDFNNMMTAILGSSEVLHKISTPNANSDRLIARIKKAAHRGADLTQRLLTFARLDAYKIQPVNINHLLNDLVNLLDFTVQKSVKISLNLAENLPMISGDHGHLQQVFLNLCMNSRDAMLTGGQITIESKLVEVSFPLSEFPMNIPIGKYVQVIFSDNGIGMDEKTLKRIFEPFFTTKGRDIATGLGLAITLSIIQNHKGFITVKSKPGQGTKFFIYFPLSEIQDKEKLTKTSSFSAGKTILTIDDEIIISDTTGEILSNLGYNVIPALSGPEAIAIYKEKKEEIDLAILDLEMPELNGLQTYLELKKINPDIKVLVMSGFIRPEMRKKLNNEGVKLFLQEPCTTELLEKSLGILLSENSLINKEH